jgi:uncharacterized protein (DUF2267 family)
MNNDGPIFPTGRKKSNLKQNNGPVISKERGVSPLVESEGPVFPTGRSVKKKSTTVSPSEQNQEDVSSATSTMETKKPSVSSGSVGKGFRGDVKKKEFYGDAGAGKKSYILDETSGIPVWKEFSNVLDESNRPVYGKTITDPVRVKTLNKFFKQGASTSEVDKIYTGFPGQEDNQYREYNGSWQRMQPTAKSWTTVNEPNAVAALNKQFNKDIKPIKGLNVVKEGAKFTDINTKLVSQTEGNVVPYLQKKYSKLGFTFEEAGIGQDFVTVTAKDGKTKIDVSLDEANPEEALKLRHFLSQNASTPESKKSIYLKAKREEDPNYSKTPEYINALKSLSPDEVEDLIDERKEVLSKKLSETSRDFDLGGYKKAKEDLDSLYSSEEYKIYKEKKSEKQKERATKVDQLYYELNNAKTTKDKQYIKSKINTFLSDDIIQKQTDGYNMQLMDVQNAYKKINSEYTNLNSAAASGKLTQEQYDAQLAKLNQKRVDLKENSDGVISQMKKLEKVTGKYLLDKEKMGSFGGNLLNAFVTGISKMVETPAAGSVESSKTQTYEALSPEEKKYLSDKGYSREQAINYVANKNAKKIKEEIRGGAVEFMGARGTTKEYSQSKDRGFFESTLAGVAESLPSMIIPGGALARTAAMSSQAYASIEDEMLNDEDFETTSMADRSLVAMPYAVGMGLLENLGFTKMISKDPLAKSLVMKSITKVMTKKGTTETLESALEKELKSNITKYGLKVVGGTLAEAETGALQSALLDVGLKTVYNKIRNYREEATDEEIAKLTNQGYFNTPDNLSEASIQVLKDAAAEGIGGKVMTSAMTGFEMLSNGEITLFNDDDITKLKELSSDPEMKKMFVAKLRTDMVNGDITKEQAKTKLEALRSVESDFNRIPDDITGTDLKRAVELSIEKKDLTNEIAGKDEALIAPKKARIEEINNELKTIGENATKESNKQEGGTEGDIVQREGVDVGQQEGGQGEGSQRETTQPSTDTSDSNIGSQEEINKSRNYTDENYEVVFNDPNYVVRGGAGNKATDGYYSWDRTEAINYADGDQNNIFEGRLKDDSKILELETNNPNNYEEIADNIKIFEDITGVKYNSEEFSNIYGDVKNKLKEAGYDAVRGATIDGLATVVLNPKSIEPIKTTPVSKNQQPVSEAATEPIERKDIKIKVAGTFDGFSQVYKENVDDNENFDIKDTRSTAKKEKGTGNVLNSFDESIEDGSQTINIHIPIRDNFARQGGVTFKIKIPNGKNVNAQEVSDAIFEANKNIKLDARQPNVNDNIKSLLDAGLSVVENTVSKEKAQQPVSKTTAESVEKNNKSQSQNKDNNNNKSIEEEADRLSKLLSSQNIENILPSFNDKTNKTVIKNQVSKILPEVKIISYDTNEEYNKEVGDSSRGTYDYKKNTIHINLERANNRTVSHEVFHAILLSKVKSNAEARRLTKSMINSVMKSLVNAPNGASIYAELNKFASSYEENLVNEEKLAELFGYLADTHSSLPVQTKNIIARFLERIAKFFGLKPMTDTEVVEFMNELSRRVETGIEISDSDIKSLGTGKIKVGDIENRKSNFINSLVFERFETNKNTKVIKNFNLKDIDGQVAGSTLSDKLMAGMLKSYKTVKGQKVLKDVYTFFGGIGYPEVTGYIWASSKRSIANAIVDSMVISKDGYRYLIPAIMSDTSHMSNKNMTSITMEVFKEAFSNKELNRNEFKDLVSKAFNNKDTLKYKEDALKSISGNISANDMADKLNDFIISSKMTFEARKSVLISMVGDPKSGNPKFSTVGTYLSLATSLSEPMIKDATLHQVATVIRTKGDLSVVETSKDDKFYHPSYGFHIESDQDIEVLHLDNVYNLTDIIPEFKKKDGSLISTEQEIKEKTAKGWDIKNILKNLGRTHGLSVYSAPIVSDRKQNSGISKIIKFAKENGFSDASVVKHLTNSGYTNTEAIEELRRYNAVKDNVFLNDPKTGLPKIAQSIKKWSKDQLTTKGNRPNSMFEAQENMEGVIAEALNKVVRISKDFNKVYNAIPKDLREKFLENYDAYLRGNKKVDISEDAKIVANEMRNQIDALSINIINAGLAPSKVAKEIQENLGSYLTRSYEVFKNKDYKAKEEIIQRAKNLLMKQKLNEAKRIAKIKGTDVDFELNRIVNNKINEYTNKISADDFLGGGKLGSKSKEIGVFKERTNIPIEIRQLMGEFTDPVQNYAETVTKLSALAAKNDFLNKIKDAGMGVYLFTEKTRPEGYNVMIAAPGSDAMNPLNGLYTTPEIAKEFNNLPGELGKLMKIYMKAISMIKWGKTIGSVMTHAKNLFGNLGFVAVNGHTSGAVDAFKAIYLDISNSSNEEIRKRIDKYIKLGIMKQSASIGEIRDMFKDADFDKSLAERLSKRPSIKKKPIASVLGRGKRIAKSIGSAAETAYQAEDDFFKVLAYESELRRYAKAEFNKDVNDLTDSERAKIDETVANIVKDTMPTFSRIPKIVKTLRKSPLLGNFISFQAESYRTAFKTMQLAKSEITSKNPAIRAIGARRVIGTLTYLSAKNALLSFYGSAFGMGLAGLAGYFGDDDDEKEKEKDLRKFLPPWSTQSDIIPIKNSDGTITYIDMSASDPHGGIGKAFNAFFSGDDPIDGAKEAMFSIFKPFLEPEMTAKALFNSFSNNDNYDRPIWNSEDDWNGIVGDIGMFVFGVAQPGTVTSAIRIAKSEDKLKEVIGASTGYRPIKIDVGESFGYRVYDYRDRLDKAKELYSSVSRNEKATDEEKEKALQKANSKTEEIYKQLMEDYNSAERLGVDSGKLRTELKDKLNLSEENLKKILSGGYTEVKPKKVERPRIIFR